MVICRVISSPGLWSLVIKCSGCLLVTAVAWHSLRPGPGESQAQAQALEIRRKWNVAWPPVLRAWDPAISPGDHTFTFLYPPLTQSEEPGNVLCLQASHWHTHSYVTSTACEQSVKTFLRSKVVTQHYLHISVVKRHNMEMCCGCVVLRGFWGAFYSRFAHSEWEKTTSCIHKFCRYDWNLNKYILIREINLIKQVM